MKKIITTSMLACAFVATAFANESVDLSYDKMRFGVSVDYTSVAMKRINEQLSNGNEVTDLKSGISGTLDFGVALAPFLMAGIRAGYLQGMPASTSFALYDQKIYASLLPLEAGASAKFELPATPVSIMAGVYGGYGFAFASVENEPAASDPFTVPFHGGGFVAEVPVVVNFKLYQALAINVNGGYRFATIPEMQQSEDVTYSGIPIINMPVGEKGDVLKDEDNSKIALDFGGFFIGIGFSLGF